MCVDVTVVQKSIPYLIIINFFNLISVTPQVLRGVIEGPKFENKIFKARSNSQNPWKLSPSIILGYTYTVYVIKDWYFCNISLSMKITAKWKNPTLCYIHMYTIESLVQYWYTSLSTSLWWKEYVKTIIEIINGHHIWADINIRTMPCWPVALFKVETFMVR